MRKTTLRSAMATLAAILVVGLLPSPALAIGSILDVHEPLVDIDIRNRTTDELNPTPQQKAAVEAMGAHALWNRFGTPISLINYDGYLAEGLSSDAVEAARTWVSSNAGLFRLSQSDLDTLEVLSVNPIVGTPAKVVLFRQRFGDLPAARGGLIHVGVREGKIYYAASTAAGGQTTPPEPQLSPADALLRGLANVGVEKTGSQIAPLSDSFEWTRFQVAGLSHPQSVRLVAIPQTNGDTRSAFEVNVLHSADGESLGYRVFVDAVSGDVLIRSSTIDQLLDNPRWKVFENTPPVNFGDRDTRKLACWENLTGGQPVQGCQWEVKNDEAFVPWDVDPVTNQPNFTTRGNAANTALSSLSPLTPSDNYRPVSPEREYIYPWNNYWYNEKCPRQNMSPDMNENDMNAAIVNLFAMHNRIHDFAYRLGFTEPNFNLQQQNFAQGGRPGDPETGNAAAGFVTGGAPSYTGRDNANQITPPDGITPITNMYLWQQVAGAFYPPCVDGDFDMSVIAHEYGHAISNRMVGGPDDGLEDRQGGSMGESWSDLQAIEYLAEHNFAPVGNENPYSVGAYVTGNKQRGIRNFGMNRSPLNYSDVGYDFTGAQVHADGEIWSATNFDIRKAMIRKYNDDFPADDEALQLSCAEGRTAPNQCPGNRRWYQIVFDAWLLMPPDVQFIGARDAYLAADRARFNGDNQKLLWKAFAKRGMGVGAAPGTRRDGDEVAFEPPEDVVKPSFDSPRHRNEARVTLLATGAGGKRIKAKLFVGRFEARVSPVADTNRKSKLPATVKMTPGRYEFIAQAKGYGMVRFKKTLKANQRRTFRVRMQKNWASRKNKAKASSPDETAAGPATALIDDTEVTNWTGSRAGAKGARVTIDLGGGAHRISRIAVSAMLRPRRQFEGQGDPEDPAQNRFTAMRSFRVMYCRQTKARDCSGQGKFQLLFRSSPKAFPSVKPRPVVADMTLNYYRVNPVRATHIRLVVIHNQCTGQKQYHGEQDSDATNTTDCREGSAHDDTVRAAELQVFSRKARVRG